MPEVVPAVPPGRYVVDAPFTKHAEQLLMEYLTPVADPLKVHPFMFALAQPRMYM